ncbi:hypothetical protein ACS0TY_028790 [Phlomoides rotata]
MATAVDIPAPVRETREEEGGELVDQATSILIKKLPNEEKSEAHAHNELSTVEGYNFLTAPSIGGVHCEVHNSSPNVSMVTEKPDQNVKDETDIVHLGKPRSDDQPTAIAANEETISGGIQQEVEESDGLDEEETKESKTHMSTDERVGDGKQTEEDTLENPAEFLHVAPENIEASILGQEKNIKSFPEDQRTNETLHENAGGETEEKSIVAVDTQKEILESVSTIASSSPKEGSINAVLLEVSSDSANEKTIDGTGTQKEVLESVSNEDVKGNSTENGEPRNVEFCENESTESTVLKIESKMEKSEDPMHAASEDINAPEIEARSCIEEQSVETHPQGILDEKTEDEAVDAAEKEGIIENVPTAVSIEKTEDNSLIQVGGPKMEKDADKPSTVEDFTGNNVTDELKIDDENPSGAELLEEKNTESALLKEEVQKEKPLESLHAALEDIKPSDLDQHTETTSFLEEKSLSENPQEILSEETEEKTIDAVSNEDNSKDSSIQVDAREREQDAYLEKEMEPSLTKASVEDANYDESINLDEPKIGNECNEDLQNASEDHKASASSEDIETTHSHEESLVMNDYTIEETNAEDTHEVHNVTTEIQHEQTEENSVTLVDCSQIEQVEHLEKDGESSSWTEAPIEETKADESKNIQEPKNKGTDSMKAELKNEKDTESTSVKEEAEVDNPIDSLQTANHDIEASDSSQDTNNCTAEQLPTATPEELSCDQTEKESVDAAEAKEESLEDIVTNIPDGDKADNTPIEEDGSQEPSLKDTTLGNNNAEDPTIAHEAKPVGENEKITECTSVKEEVSTESSALGQDEETSSLEEKSLTTKPQGIMDDTEDKTNGAIVAEEETPEDKENIGKTTPYEDIEENMLVQEEYPQMEQKKELENDSENTSSREGPIGETTEGSLDKEEAQVEKPTEDTKESESCQETYPVDEKILSANHEEIPCDKTEETTTDSAYTKNENLEVQNVENVPNEGSDNSQTEVEGPQKTSLEETSIGNYSDAESTIIHDAKFADENIVKADLLGNEESIECALVKEEVPLKSLQEETQEEKPIDSSQAAQEETKESDSIQDTNSYIEEKSLTAYPQEISSDKTERESIDAINRREESIEDIPDGDDAVNSPIEEEYSQKPHQKEATTRNYNDDESTVTNKMKFVGENEKDIECALVKEEVSTELLQVAAQGTKVSAIGQDRETSSLEVQPLTTDPQGFIDETKEDKTNDATGAEEGTPEDKDVATTPYEDIEENLLVEVDCKQAEQNEDSVNDSENTSLTEALIRNTGEGTLVKEEAHEEKHFKSLQVATEDFQASDSCQETSSIEEQILMSDAQEISCDRVEEKTADAAYTKKENLEEVATKIPNVSDEDNSPLQVDGLQKPPLEEASTIIHEALFVDESKVEADLSQNETKMECGLVQEEVSVRSMQVENEDFKPTASSQDREISQVKGQDLTTNPQEIVGDYGEGKTIDVTELKEEVLEDKSNATTPHEDTIEKSLIEVDCIQLEQNENLEKASENTSLTEAPTADTIENILVKEKAEEEDHHIESLQVATEDMQASASCQETSSIEEQILTGESHETKFVDESKVEADLSQNETTTECGLVQEEVPVKSMQVENEDIKPTASSQDREISQVKGQDLTTNPQEIVGDYEEGKTIDVTELKEEVLEDKSNATTPHEDTIEKSLIEVDCIQLEQNENLEKASENTSLTEAPTTDTIENILVKEKAEEEDRHIESLQVAAEDMQASASCQETSSIEEQILTGDLQEISCDKTEEKTIDSAYTVKESFEDVAINVPSEDNEDSSPIEVDGSQKPSLKDDHESTIRHDTKFADDLSENEKNVKCDLVKEEASVTVKSLEVEDEDTKSTTSNEERETGHIEEQGTNPQGIMGDHKENKLKDVTDLKEVTHEDKSYATISNEETTENSSVQEDCSQLEQNEHSEKDNEITSLTEALETDTTESTLVKEEAQNEDHTESLQVATEDVISFSPCQDTETSSTKEQVLTVDPEDISSDKIIEKTIDASDNEKTTEVQVENEDIKVIALSQDKETSHLEEQGLNTNPQGIMGDNKEDKTVDVPDFKEESLEDKSYATTSYEDSEESSFVQVDCSQLEQIEHSEKDGESTSLTDALAADTIERTLVKEEAHDEDHIESMQAATEDVKAFSPSQDTNTSSTEEQILTVDPEDISRDKTIENIIDASEKEEKNTEGTLKEDACTESSQEANEDIKASNSSEDRDAHSQKEQILGANPEGLKDEAPKEIENIDFEARNIELKEEEGSLKDMSTAVDIAALEEKDSDSIAVKIPCTKDLDVVEEVAVGHHAEDPDSKQEESSIKVVPEVHMIISHENVPDVTSLPSEVVEDANSGGDKTDTENIAVQDDGSTMIPTNETLPETDPRGGTEAEVQVPDGEKEAELVQDDPTTETDQKFIEGELLIKDSQVISEFKRVNDEEEKTNSDNCKDGSSNSAVLAEESTSNFQESRREMKEEAQNEEAQKQDEELHVSALVHDLSSGKIENQVQELEKAPLPASDENVIETTECKESETVEDAIKSKEGDDRTESFFTDKNATEKEQEEKESGQEKLTSDEKVQTTLSTSDLEVIDFLPTLPSETTKVDHYITEGEVATDREELNAEKTASDGSEATIIDNNRSITDLESKNDDEAPEAIQTTPSASEGQDVENMSVGETTALISECPRDGYEHANTSSATGEGPESKEFVFEPEEQRSEYGSKIQVLESVSQVQSCKIVAETEETKAEEKNLQTAGETESDKVVAEDISGQEETKHEIEILKENIPCQKIKEGDEDVEDYRQGSHQEEVIIGSHLVEEANQGKEISRGFEDIKKENEMETVPKISKEADDKTLEEPEENLLGKESINIGLDQKEHLKSVQKVATALDTEMVQVLDVGCVKKIGTQNSNEEINRSTVAIPDEEQNRTGADDTENEIAEDEGLLNQNSKIPEIDAAERELPKELDENIICEAPINTFQKTIEDPEVKKEQQDEHITRKHEILPLPELVQGKESEKQNQKDEICGSDEVQPRDEENVTHFEEKGEEENKADTWNKPNDGEETETYVEPEQLDFSFHIKDISEVPISDGVQVIQEDNESSITKLTSSEEECSNKSTDSQISTVSNDAELTEQASEATKITSELQAPKAGISSQVAIPNATEVESRQVEEANDKCKVVAETSTPVELPKISTSKITLEAEEQQTKFHDLPQELNIRDTEVMAEKDDPGNLQNVRDVSQDAQGSNEGSFEVSNKENPVEASPDENIETSEEQETEAVQNASVLETLKQETEQQQLGRAPENVTEAGVNCEEEKIINDKFNQLEKSWSAETEKVSESNTTAQHDNVEGSPRQIDSLSILPEAKCSEIETAEKEHFAGVNDTGVTELEVTTPPSKDKHLVLEADHTTVLSSENTNGNEKLSAECSGERDLLEPSKVEQQEADCGNEERTDQEIAGKPESEEATKPSLSDLFDVSMRETSKMAEHSATDEEPTTHTEDLHAEKPDEDQHENAKTEEEHDDDDDESSEQRGSELSSEAPVIVDMADADVKVSHKKSHNILSGVGSKVKHSIAKVKKAITGKSSHPKPPSPKKYTS